jgi:uncharacterized protein YneF (UPF0154 family)
MKFKMINRIIWAFGLALIIGVVAGYYLSQEKYYIAHYDIPKREITKDAAKELDAQYVIKENVYNTGQGVVVGVAAFGFFLLLGSFLKRKDTSNKT